MLATASSVSQTADTAAVRRLREAGFENIRAARSGDTLFVAAENRAWRWAPRGAGEMAVAAAAGSNCSVLSLTLLSRGIPVTTLTFTGAALANPADTTPGAVTARLSDAAWRRHLRSVRPVHRSFLKGDISVAPLLRMQFGNYDHPLEGQFSVVPSMTVDLLPGLSATAQVIVPLFGNLSTDPEGNAIRPGLVTIGYAARLPFNIFASVAAGYFTRNRYGVAGEARMFFFNGRLSAGAAAGWTGNARMDGGYFTYGPADRFTWGLDAAFRVARYDLTLKAGYGGYIAGDRGWRVEAERQFGEISLGFYAMQTGDVVNGGFSFTVPLPPRRYGTKGPVRLRPASYVAWEYRAKGLPSAGRSFDTGCGVSDLLFNLNPDYLRSHVRTGTGK